MTDENKIPIFLDKKVKLQPGQAVVAIFSMKNLTSLSDGKQVCLVQNPNSQSSVISGKSFSVTRNGLCVSVLLNTLDTTVSIQRGKKLGYALPTRIDYEETQNLKRYSVKDCRYHANKDKILKRDNELNSFHKLLSLKYETDDGLSSCSNFPERPSLYELETDKPVLPEIEHLKGKIGEGDFEFLRAVLNRNADVFSKHKVDIGCCNFVEHEIELEEGAVPHREGARRMTPHKSEACRAEIEMLLEYDIIEPSKLPWACGVVMVKKKGGQLRFYCDFCYLNAVTIKDAYPIPLIDESLSKLGDAKFFTTLDLGSAFWQVPLRPIAYGSKVLSDTEMKYGTPNAEMFAVVTFVEKYRAYLGSAPFKLRVDNRALSWLKTYSIDQSYIGRWIVRLDGYLMITEHRMRDKHQNADSLSKKTESYERLEQKQVNQAEIKEGFSFLHKETYEALPLTRWLDKSGHPILGHPELPVEKAAEMKILSQKDPVPLDLLLCSNLVQQKLSRMNINSLSLLDKTVQVTPQVMRMLGGLLEREVTRDGPEWAAALASLTVSEKVKIMPSRRQHKENERDHTVGKNRRTIRKRKPLPLRTRRKKVRRLNETWYKIVCPGRRTVRRTGDFKINRAF